MRDPPGEDSGLAGAGARDDQQRAVAVHDRIPLRLREVGERIAGNLDRPDRAGDELQLIRSTWRYQVLLSSPPHP